MAPLSRKLYVRVRRRNQTFFVLCDESDTALYLKQEVACALREQTNGKTAPEASSMRLLTTDGTVLEDGASLTDIQNDQEVHIVFPIADNEWEEVNIMSTEEGADAPMAES